MKNRNADYSENNGDRKTIIVQLETLSLIHMLLLQYLLQDALISTGHVQQAALIHRESTQVKAKSIYFDLSREQIQFLLNSFEKPNKTREKGIELQGRMYRCVRVDGNSIYAKLDKKGLVMARTDCWLIIATYTDNMYPSVCVEAVEKLDYFKAKGK